MHRFGAEADVYDSSRSGESGERAGGDGACGRLDGDGGHGWVLGSNGSGQPIGFADEVGDESVCGMPVDLAGGANLFDAAVTEDGHAIGHGEGFFLVVSDVEGG